MVKKLVFFGDSWCYGSELLDPALIEKGYDRSLTETRMWRENTPYREKYRFSDIVASTLDLECENYSEPGNSLIGMRANLIDWVTTETDFSDTVCIFANTHYNRYSFYDNAFAQWRHSPWLDDAENFNQHYVWKPHLVFSACRELNEYTLLDFTITSKSICNARGMEAYYAPVFQPVDDPNCTPFTLKQWVEIEERNGHDVWQGDHPNELGHKLIAKHLIKFLKERKIVT